MEWSKFIITVAVIYIAYYGFNFLRDLLNNGKKTNKDEIVQLTIEDDTPVKSVDNYGETDSPIIKDKPVNYPKEQLTNSGVINEEVLTNINERKEEYFSPTDVPVTSDESSMMSPTGSIKVLAQNLISGGLSYKELIKQATQGSILKSATIDFGEEA